MAIYFHRFVLVISWGLAKSASWHALAEASYALMTAPIAPARHPNLVHYTIATLQRNEEPFEKIKLLSSPHFILIH